MSWRTLGWWDNTSCLVGWSSKCNATVPCSLDPSTWNLHFNLYFNLRIPTCILGGYWVHIYIYSPKSQTVCKDGGYWVNSLCGKTKPPCKPYLGSIYIYIYVYMCIYIYVYIYIYIYIHICMYIYIYIYVYIYVYIYMYICIYMYFLYMFTVVSVLCVYIYIYYMHPYVSIICMLMMYLLDFPNGVLRLGLWQSPRPADRKATFVAANGSYGGWRSLGKSWKSHWKDPIGMGYD